MRGVISSLYELSYPYYKAYEDERTQFKIHQTSPILLEHFDWVFKPNVFSESSYQISTAGYEKIIKDGSLRRVIHATAMENSVVRNRARRIEGHILSVLEFLEEEL